MKVAIYCRLSKDDEVRKNYLQKTNQKVFKIRNRF